MERCYGDHPTSSRLARENGDPGSCVGHHAVAGSLLRHPANGKDY